jgi:hypothetical protein
VRIELRKFNDVNRRANLTDHINPNVFFQWLAYRKTKGHFKASFPALPGIASISPPESGAVNFRNWF